MRHLPFSIAGDWHGVPALVFAPQRGLRCMGNLLCMRLFLDFGFSPTPWVLDIANDSLTALVDMNMFDSDLVPSFATVLAQRAQ